MSLGRSLSPQRLKPPFFKVIAAESAANDGLAYPFLR